MKIPFGHSTCFNALWAEAQLDWLIPSFRGAQRANLGSRASETISGLPDAQLRI
jgi:hypothetical protein